MSAPAVCPVTNLLVLTCARTRNGDADPWQYIKRTLPPIDAERVPGLRKGIVCDGPYEGPRPPGWDVYEFQRPPGNLRAGNKLPYWHLLRVGLDLGGDLLALEDDVSFARNAVRRMATFPIPDDLAWVQFFSPMVIRTFDTYPGLWRPPAGSSSFLQAAKFPERTLQRLIEWQENAAEFSISQASDSALAIFAPLLGLSYGVHVPDLVQHVGELSEAQEDTKELKDRRTSVCFPSDPGFDSMSLYLRDELFR